MAFCPASSEMSAKRAKIIRETRIYSKRDRRKKAFRNELLRQISLHKEGPWKLASAVAKPEERFTRRLVLHWISGNLRPRWGRSFEILNRIETRYGLPKNYFKNILLPDTPTEQAVRSVSHVMHDVMRWHLPKNFDLRPKRQRDDILSWISLNVMPGATEYGQYLRRLSKTQYRLRIPAILDVPASENFIAIDGKPFKPRIRKTSTRFQVELDFISTYPITEDEFQPALHIVPEAKAWFARLNTPKSRSAVRYTLIPLRNAHEALNK